MLQTNIENISCSLSHRFFILKKATERLKIGVCDTSEGTQHMKNTKKYLTD